MNLDKSMAFYKDRLADAGGFTFTFVGSFEPDEVKPLVEKYLASLPSSDHHEMWRDVGMRPPKGVIEKRVEKGLEPKSQTAIVFTGPFDYNQTERVSIRAMADVLTTRLRNKIREDLGGTYSINVSPGYSKVPTQQYSVEIDFGSNPDRTEGLIKSVMDEIEAFKASGPTEQEVADERETLIRDAETNGKQNAYLVSQISLRYEYGESVDSLFGLDEYYKKLTPAMLQDAAKRYLDSKNYVQVSLFPEK